MRSRIAIVLSKFLKPIAIGLGIFVFISVISAFQANGNTSGANIALYAAIATAFVSYGILEFCRRFFFRIDILEEAATKGETVVDSEFDSRFQTALDRKRESEATEQSKR
ncbi:MAG: hypothetical protein HQ477_11920 [Chloroflexi bacterium]|nr:hypothetical protein [Chloroflexota bacterium]